MKNFLQKIRQLRKPISTELEKTDSIDETSSQKTIDATRRSILQSMISVGLSSVLLNGCTAENSKLDFRNNFDIDQVDVLPENERGRDYIAAPKLTMADAKNFLENMDESVFPIKLSNIIKVKEVQNQPVFSPDFDAIKIAVKDFLAAQPSSRKLLNLTGGESYLEMAIEENGKTYNLSMPGYTQIQIDCTDKKTTFLMLEQLHVARISSQGINKLTGLDEMRIESINFGDQQTIKNIDGRLHLDSKDNSLEIFDASTLLKFLQENQNIEIYNLKETLFTNKLINGINLNLWIELTKELPKDSIKAYTQFYSNFVKYADLDKKDEDEFRDPIDALSSGWADCDDFVMINAIWAKLNGYSGRIIKVDSTMPPGLHYFLEITNGKKTHVIDNNHVTENINAEEYMAETPKYTMVNPSLNTF